MICLECAKPFTEGVWVVAHEGSAFDGHPQLKDPYCSACAPEVVTDLVSAAQFRAMLVHRIHEGGNMDPFAFLLSLIPRKADG